MSKLYQELSEVYEAMYRSFVNYDEEFVFYSKILLNYNCKSVLEIGCGTGNLAGRFGKNGFVYSGLDLSDDMLNIARKNHPQCRFIQGDMRDFSLPKQTDATVITGRTISYMITNNDVYDAFLTINKNLNTSGIVCFDFIDANKFIPVIKKDKRIEHKASFGEKKFHRDSFWSINFSQSWTFDWLSVYYKEEGNGDLTKIGEDNSTIRAFSKDEISLFLQLTGFEVKEIIPRSTYAFDTFVFVAEKIKHS